MIWTMIHDHDAGGDDDGGGGCGGGFAAIDQTKPGRVLKGVITTTAA